jgi:hypothetical protein
MFRGENADILLGSLVEVVPGALRVIDDLHNLGIVMRLELVLGQAHAEIVTNRGTRRLIPTPHLHVLSNTEEAL